MGIDRIENRLFMDMKRILVDRGRFVLGSAMDGPLFHIRVDKLLQTYHKVRERCGKLLVAGKSCHFDIDVCVRCHFYGNLGQFCAVLVAFYVTGSIGIGLCIR
jgi:hypothetical protein